MTRRKDTLRLVEMALLAAVIVVLQAYIVIPLPGGLTLSLVMVPLVLGAVLFGPAAGALLGGVFGGVVTVLVMINRAGALSALMWVENPIATVLICLLKGIAAGWCAGMTVRLFKRHRKTGIVLAAAVAPIVNTGIFTLGMFTVFYDTFIGYADASRAAILGGETADVITTYLAQAEGVSFLLFAVLSIVMLNFAIEFVSTLLLSPTIAAIVRAIRRR